MAILILTIFMSSKFSKKLTSFGESFLLVYQSDLARLNETVNVQLPEYEKDKRELERIMRYHRSAIEDADRQIKIL